jgi:hypothetical protein
MTTIGIYLPDQITKAEANAIRAGFAEILAEMNITSAYHKSKHGSPGLGLAMLDSGQLYIGLTPDEPYDRLLIEQLRHLTEYYEECDPYFVREVGQELETLADRLQAAVDRGIEP